MKRVTASLLIGVLLLSGCGNVKNVSTVESVEPSVSVSEEVVESVEEPVEEIVPEYIPTADEIQQMVFDTQVAHQKWEGFGAAYTWYGDRLYNAKDSEGGYDALFSDAKLTILRFKNEYEYNVEGKAGNATAMLRNYKEARDRAGLYGEKVTVLLCCWSPPAYLKSDNTIKSGYGTLAKDEKGNYKYEEYAKWWTESVKCYREKGIPVDFVSIQNEVDFSPASYEGCRFDAKETSSHAGYAQAFVAVYKAFQEEFGEDAPKLIGPETMSCSPGSMLTYTKAINELCPEALSGLAFHLYQGGDSDEDENTVAPTSFFLNFNSLESYFPEDRKWETEFYIGRGIQTAQLIQSALTNAELTAYLYWSGIWNDDTPRKFESADLIEINSSGKWRRSANYYVMRHYSEFIRPGYDRIEDAGFGKVKTVTFANESRTKVGSVLINTADEDIYYNVSGKDYTITKCEAFQSVFGDLAENEENMYKPLGDVAGKEYVLLPGKSVTSLDITGYYGNTPMDPPEIVPITYDEEEEQASAAPTEDTVIISTGFDSKEDVKAFSGFGSADVRFMEKEDANGKGCMKIGSRQADWNGGSLSASYFEHYGYLAKVSYDCMLKEGGSVSCTSSFVVDGQTYYPSVENSRVVCEDMEAGKWYHAEGYTTLYSNMSPETFNLYFESAGNTYDIYIDNVEVTVLYTKPAGEYK